MLDIIGHLSTLEEEALNLMKMILIGKRLRMILG
jgi:hypothetical protein